MSEGCERFAVGSVLRAICEGVADLPPHKINAYREKWNLPPLDLSNRANTSTIAPPAKPAVKKAKPGCRTCNGKASAQKEATILKPNGRGPGSQLLKIFSEAGFEHCEACVILAGKMDRWSTRGCRARIDIIVDDILPRAKTWMEENKPWVHRLLSVANAEDAALRLAIRQKVQLAIQMAEGHGDSHRRRSDRWKPTGNWRSAFQEGDGLPEYVTSAQLAQDTLALIPKLPPDITRIVGVSRSGLCPASILSMMLHLPLTIVRHHQGDWVDGGNGWRLNEGTPEREGKLLIVDDTTMTGNSLSRTQHVLKDMPGEKVYAAVYVNPLALTKPDIWAVDLPWPHLLEWNLFNSVLLDSFALDFDGILCHDCPLEDDDDGPRYEKFLRDVQPLHLVRKRPVKMIVTARLDKYRLQTLDWLDRWGVKVEHLVMGPWKTKRERQGGDVVAFKAEHFSKFIGSRGGVPPKMFIESDPKQAEKIANLSGGLVVCPRAERCYR